MTPEEKRKFLDINKERGELRKALQSLSDSVLLYVDWMDTKIGPEKSISKPVSSLIAKGINALVLVNDRVRYGSLGIDFRKDDKAKAIKKLKGGRKP
uniref:Uncharacterized protein n=1 Tax=viral metagenome TaxID=1070528 RepID=A0A6H1ZZ81_9ZZZZ